MVYSVSDLILIACGYLFFLFMVAWITERGWLPARWVRHPAVYVFSLGVYASAWAVYGSVGYAYQYGYNFLSYFLGISGVFLLAPILLAPILRLTTNPSCFSRAVAWRAPNRMAKITIIRQKPAARSRGSEVPLRIWMDSATAFNCSASSGSTPMSMMMVVMAPARRLR